MDEARGGDPLATLAHATNSIGMRDDAVSRVNSWFLGVVLYLFLLAPYLTLGGFVINGGVLSLLVLALGAPQAMARALSQRRVYELGAFYLAAAFYSAFVASLYNTDNLVIVKLFVSVIVYLVMGHAVGFWLKHHGLAFEEAFFLVLKVCLAIVVMNSALVIAEFYLPGLKGVVESFLADPPGINYKTHPFRLRGIASAGGAALSLFHGFGVWMALKLYRARRIPVWLLALSLLVIPFSVLFIGRTAVVVIALAVGFFVLENVSIRRAPILASVALVLAIGAVIFARNIDYFIPEEVQKYSLLFFLGGVEGLEREGTLGVLRGFLVIPSSGMHLLFGIGYFSGANVLGVASDSGYIKTLLAFGLPLAIAVYASFIHYVWPLVKHIGTRGTVLVMLIMLFIVEVKEPFVFQGYVARLMFALGGIGVVYLRSTGVSRSAN